MFELLGKLTFNSVCEKGGNSNLCPKSYRHSKLLKPVKVNTEFKIKEGTQLPKLLRFLFYQGLVVKNVGSQQTCGC